jgi:RNA polymerase sigma-70 factor (ECF subfamily)
MAIEIFGFNEGYHSASNDHMIRKDLCAEAIRIGIILFEHPVTQSPKGTALLSLMCLLASRFEARVDEHGEIILLEDQDRSKWDQELIKHGMSFLEKSATGTGLSSYHIEAAIISEHTLSPSFEKTNWSRILELYNLLIKTTLPLSLS